MPELAELLTGGKTHAEMRIKVVTDAAQENEAQNG